jgi:hypothetical protein
LPLLLQLVVAVVQVLAHLLLAQEFFTLVAVVARHIQLLVQWV